MAETTLITRITMSNDILTGKIIRSLGGFYNVYASDDKIYPCKPRGIFRKNKVTPLVGDTVKISHIEDETASIDFIEDRKNVLVRPPVANIDKLFIVVSTVDPSPNLLIIDKTIAAAEMNNIEPILIISKTDLLSMEELKKTYSSIGIKVLESSPEDDDCVDEIRALLLNSVSAFTGNSGVGKSTIINRINPELLLQTGETSKKLGRGKHTTRHVELFEVAENSYVVDTPGFSTFDIEKYNMKDRTQLYKGFREFEQYVGYCKFTSCSHTTEKGCAIIDAVNSGEIPKSRFDSYVSMYNEIKDIKEWQK